MNRGDWHFVVYGYDIDYFGVMFAEAVEAGGVEYVADPVSHYSGSRAVGVFHRFCEHPRLRRMLHLDGHSIWRRWLIGDYVDVGKRLCFVFLMRWLKPGNEDLFLTIRRRYPDAMIVVYLEDLYETGVNLDYSMMTRHADLVVSYDKGDAAKHGFLYYPTFLSAVSLPACGKKHTDVAFCGASKQRYDLIVRTYEALVSRGLECDFMVSRLHPGQKKAGGIRYIRYLIPYQEYLSHVMRSDCLLEIMQDNATGYTLRTWEAILYDKVLLTNNKAIKEAPFYNPEQFIYFETPDDIPGCLSSGRQVHNPYSGNLSPVKFFDFLASRLS